MLAEAVHCFEPVVDGRSRVLVLGTMPSVASLEEGFYYAHPRNAFWPILARLMGVEAPQSAPARRALALASRVALWDVARCCVRRGSGDAAMRQVEVNDFGGLFARYPRLSAVFLNGGTAYRLFTRRAAGAAAGRAVYSMPSTSPAYTLSFEEKLAAWGQLRRTLEEIEA